MAHGKKSRNRARIKRLNEKRARRAARQALWDSLKGTGKNRKKKLGGGAIGEQTVFARVKALVYGKVQGKVQLVERMVHGGNACGNIGCKKCSPIWSINS